MKQHPKVSILVAIYNVERYLSTCIKSIIDQTYSNIEIILVDDGSPDNCGKICDDFAKNDERVKVIHQENGRLPKARNTGLDAATGEYIVFVDGDDFLAQDYVEYMLYIEEITNADIVMSKNVFTSKNPKQIKNDYIEKWSIEKAYAEFCYPRLFMGVWNKMYRRSFIEENGFRFIPGLFTAEGFRFFTTVVQSANHVGVGSRKVYYYRKNNLGSATVKPDIRQGVYSLEILDDIKKDLKLDSSDASLALDWHIWSDNFLLIKLIINTKTKEENVGYYKRSIKYLRDNTLGMLSAQVSMAYKMRMMLICLFPDAMARVAILLKDYYTKRDKMRD